MKHTILTHALGLLLAIGLLGCDASESVPVSGQTRAQGAEAQREDGSNPGGKPAGNPGGKAEGNPGAGVVAVAKGQTASASPKQTELHSVTQPFFQKNCVKCHGPKKQKGKVRLDTLQWKPDDPKQLKTWQKVIDQLKAGDMPPEERPRPDGKQLKNVITQLQASLAQAASIVGHKQVVLRRLNRIQYRNTIRDLLHIDVLMEDPTEAFPADDVVDGFDNIGDGLMMSDFLLRQYLHVARAAVDRATFDSERPKPMTYRMFDKSKRRFNFLSKGAISESGCWLAGIF